jgi:ribose transport system substrate-binding protein
MLFVGTLDAQNAKDRFEGVKEALAGTNIQIIDVRTDETDRTRAKANVQDTLVKYPDVACLVGLWSYNGPAIVNAVRDSGKAGQVKIVCFDEEDETLAGVKSGDIYATVVQQPFEFGHQSMINLAKVIGGDKSVIPDTKQIFIPTIAIKKDNVDDFQTKLNKLRGRN